MWDLVRDSGQRKLTYSSQNHCTSTPYKNKFTTLGSRNIEIFFPNTVNSYRYVTFFAAYKKQMYSKKKNQQILSADFFHAGKGTWTLMTAIVTRTWTVRVCQFRHSCLFHCSSLSRNSQGIYYSTGFEMSTLFLYFSKSIFFIFFRKSLDIMTPFCYHTFLSGTIKWNDTCGSVGTGRRARLRILWLLQSCGFKSHLPHQRPQPLVEVFFADGDMNPGFISPLRYGRCKPEIHRISCTPSSALFNLVRKPYISRLPRFFCF